jgi:hypothetical protein
VTAASKEALPKDMKTEGITLMMEAASTSETSVNFYQITRRNIPEDSHLQQGKYSAQEM